MHFAQTLVWRVVWVLLLVAAEGALGQSAPLADKEGTIAAQSPDTDADAAAPLLDDQFNALFESLKSVEADRASRKQQLRNAQDESEKRRLNEEIERLALRTDELRMSIEDLATGGIRVSAFEQQVAAQFDWKKEIEEVMRPLFDEIKQLTERPRTIERLRSEQALYESRAKLAERALVQLEATLEMVQTRPVRKEIAALRERWSNRREEASSRLRAVTAQLDHLLAPSEEERFSLAAAAREFFSGRGLNLLIAVVGFCAAYAALVGLSSAVRALLRRGRPSSPTLFARAAFLLFHALAVVLSLLASALILYVLGDWLILGLLILFVIAALWALAQSLPRYVREARILLNLGSVREGERVIYRGIPWKVKSLNVYSVLHNPVLQGGKVRLTLNRIAELESRGSAPDEPWFPSREGDFVILDGDIYGKVLRQTPEFVQLQILGATTTYSVVDYLAKNPRNLTIDGFAVPIVFGLDYQHQKDILGEVLDKLREHFGEALEGQPFRSHLANMLVDFNEAASSSLNILFVLVFAGAAAEHYMLIRRFIQRTALDACNKYAWVVPFNQLTVHGGLASGPMQRAPA